MCTSHSVMEGQRHNNPLNSRCLCLQRPKMDGWVLLTHIIVEVAKALRSSFKLVTLAPKKKLREMTQLSRETQKNGDTQIDQKQTPHDYVDSQLITTELKNKEVNWKRLSAVHADSERRHSKDNLFAV